MIGEKRSMKKKNTNFTSSVFDIIEDSILDYVLSNFTRQNLHFTSSAYNILLDLDNTRGFFCDFSVYDTPLNTTTIFNTVVKTDSFSKTVDELLNYLRQNRGKSIVKHICNGVLPETKVKRILKALLMKDLLRYKEVAGLLRLPEIDVSTFEYILRSYFVGSDKFHRALNLRNFLNSEISALSVFDFSVKEKYSRNLQFAVEFNATAVGNLSLEFSIYDKTKGKIFSSEFRFISLSTWPSVKDGKENVDNFHPAILIKLQTFCFFYQTELADVDKRVGISKYAQTIFKKMLSSNRNRKKFRSFLKQVFSEIDMYEEEEEELIKRLEDFRKAKLILNSI